MSVSPLVWVCVDIPAWGQVQRSTSVNLIASRMPCRNDPQRKSVWMSALKKVAFN